MSLERPHFTPTKTEEERSKEKGKTEGIWFNNVERDRLEEIAIFFHQPKISTTIKHCIDLAEAIIEGRDSGRVIRDTVFNNVRKNRRTGLEEIEPKFRIS